MRRTTKILQIAACLFLLAGCANQTIALTETTVVPKLEPKPVYLPANQAPKAAESIQAGTSKAMALGFKLENGELRPSIQQYALEVAKKRNIPHATVIDLLHHANYNERVSKLMSPAKTRVRRSWMTYQNRFVEPVRINAGLEFWQENQAKLQQVERLYGVPASVIVAIIGVETIYGRYMGDFSVLDALATLGFRYPDPNRPERSQLFRDQLADLIQLHHTGKLNAYSVKGSYAGAMGLPQFMPGSLLRFATDGDSDGAINLHSNVADAIASVASYLRYHGWEPGLPIFVPVTLPNSVKELVTGDINPSLTWNELQQHGVQNNHLVEQEKQWQNHLLGVIDLVDEPRNTVEYRLATPNFFAITHYNRSYFYATAVAELAQALNSKKFN